MRHCIALLLSLCCAPAFAVDEPVTLSMIAATSLTDALPYAAFSGKVWKAEPNTDSVKLHVYPDQAFDVQKMVIEGCDKSLAGDVSYFVNFEERVGDFTATAPGVISADLAVPTSLRSVTFNFHKNLAVCVKAVRFLDKSGAEIATRVPKLVAGSAVANSTLKPLQSYHVMKMFDGRLEDGWATDAKNKGATLTFTFAEPQQLTAIKIWNGYQRSAQHCFENARIKSLRVEGDGGYSATLALADIMGAQMLILPQPYQGKSLTLVVEDAYPGKTYKDLVVSELRFFNGSEPVMLDALPSITEAAAENRKKFKTAGIMPALNKALVLGEAGDEEYWLFRLRSDGSMYLEGAVSEVDYDKEVGKEHNYFGLGSYEIKKAGQGGLDVRLFGFLRRKTGVFEIGGDCNGCGHDCNVSAGGRGRKVEKIFSETLRIERRGKSYRVTNIGKRKNLKFDELNLAAVDYASQSL